MKKNWLFFFLFFGFIANAFPEELPLERVVKAKSGQDIRIAIFTNVRSDCTSGPLPTIRLQQPPEHGRVMVKKVRLSATNIQQCLALEVPALIAFYRSTTGFEGADSATLEVKSSQGAVQLHHFSIVVGQTASEQKT